MNSLGDIQDWMVDHQLILRIGGAILALVLASGVARLLTRILRRAYMRRLTVADTRSANDLERVKRQQTVLTLVESLVRYSVFLVAVVLAVGLLFGRGIGGAALGASLVALVAGFGLQRLLGDVVAGALLVFENQYSVGDVLIVHTPGVSGLVEEFALRTTTLRTFGGDRVVLMNSALTAFTVVRGGAQEVRAVVYPSDGPNEAPQPDAFANELRLLSEGLVLSGPSIRPLGSGYEITAAVVPGSMPAFEQAVTLAAPRLAGSGAGVLICEEADTPLVAAHSQTVA